MPNRISFVLALPWIALFPIYGWAVSFSGVITSSATSVVGSVTISSMTSQVSQNTFSAISTGTIPSFAVLGTTIASNAPIGQIGEYVESVAGTTLSPASGQWGDLTSIALSPGDWDVSLCAGELSNTTTRWFDFAISTTPLNSSAGITTSNLVNTYLVPLHIDAVMSVAAPYRVSISTTTTVYLKFKSDPTSRANASGRLSARRVR